MATATMMTTSASATGTAFVTAANSRSSLSSGSPTTISIVDVLASSSTLQSNATRIPGSVLGCGSGILTIQDNFPACAVLASNASTGVMSRCCRSAPVVLYAGGCNLWCEARNQTLAELNSCLSTNLRSNNASGPIMCNRIGTSYSSLLPENTVDPATRTTPTGSSTRAASPSASTGAASHIRGVSTEGSLSFGAIAAVALLTLGGFSSLLM